MKLNKHDKTFSDYIRDRDDWTCRRCGRVFGLINGKRERGLTCSHFWERRRSRTRYDKDNCISLCFPGCHTLWEHEKQGDYQTFMLTWLGKDRFDALRERANTHMKRGDADREWQDYYMALKKANLKSKGVISTPEKSSAYPPDGSGGLI